MRYGWLGRSATTGRRFAAGLVAALTAALVVSILPPSALAAPTVSAAALVTGTTTYAHDLKGRVAAEFSGDGAGVGYSYDANDTVTAVTSYPAGTLKVVQTGPATVVAGRSLDIYGTGFGTTVSAVTVTIGGATATVTSLTANRIVATVPTGAATGTVSVKVGGSTVSGGSVTVLKAPTISTVAPLIVDRSGTITIDGANFAAVGSTVRIGTTVVPTLSATSTRLTVRASGNGLAGRVSVTTAAGTGTGAQTVTVVPAPFLTADAAGAAVLPLGTRTTQNITGSNQVALFSATATAGQRLGFKIEYPLSDCYEVHVLTPSGTVATSTETVCSATNYLDLPTPAVAGTYLVEIDPRSGAVGSVAVTAQQAPDATATATVDGAAASASPAAAPGHALISFGGTKGQLVFTTLTAGGSVDRATLRGPSGQQIETTGSYYQKGYLEGALLPETGTYTVDIDPDDWTVGSFGATLTTVPAAVAATATVDGAAGQLNIRKPGQTGSVSFTGTAGQPVHVALTSATITGGKLSLTAPDGNLLAMDASWPYTIDYDYDRYTLPATGTYRFLLDPSGAQTGTLSLAVNTVPADAVVTTTIGGAAVAVGNTKPGQNARLQFTATAGQRAAVVCTPVAGHTFDLDYALVDPSGATVRTSSCYDTPQQILFDAQDLTAGAWSVKIDPRASLVATPTLQVVSVAPDAALTTTVGGASTAVTLATARNGDLRFPVTAGQRFLVSCSLGDTAYQYDVRFTLLDPSGTQQKSNGCYTSYDGLLFDTVTSATAGTWTVHVDPSVVGSTTSVLQVRSVPADLAQNATVGGAAVSSALAAGQQAVISFPVTAGQRFLIGCSLSDTTAQYEVDFTVTDPAGSSTGPGCYTSYAGMLKDTTVAPAAGTWTVRVNPDYLRALTTGVRVYAVPADVTRTATVGGSAVTVTTVVGQSGRVTFPGTAGQKVRITQTNSSFSLCQGDLDVLTPSGTVLTSPCLGNGYSDITLTAAGTYTVVVDPDYTYAGSDTVAIANAPAAAAAGQLPFRAPTPSSPAGRQPARPAATPTKDDDQAPGPVVATGPRDARLTGRILRTDGRPLGGVTIAVADRHTRTDRAGRFALARLPRGSWLLRMDGRSASTASKRYGCFDQLIGLHSGVNRPSFQPYLPILDTAAEVAITSPTTRAIVLRTPKVKGLEVHIPAGTVITDADGKPVRRIGITPIPVHRTPIPMPVGVKVPVYFTVQPAGGQIRTTGGRHVQIYYPNYFHAAAGTPTNFWTHEKYAEGWEIYGHGRVNAARTQVVPDADTYVENFDGAMINGSGILKALGRLLLEVLGAAGDPVNLSTGSFSYSQTDLSLPGNLPLEVTRSYNSADGRADRPLGFGTIDTYDAFLSSDQQYSEADLNFPDGHFVHFVRTSAGYGFTDAIMAARTAAPEWTGASLAWNGRGWDVTRRDGTTLIYGDEGPLQGLRDRFGHTITVKRTAKNVFGSEVGAIIRVSSSDGYWIGYDYDADSRISAVHDNGGRTVSYTYDAAGNLATVTDVNGGVTTYGWDANHRITTIKDALNRTFLTNSYDANGRVSTQKTADGRTYTFTYTLDGTGKLVTSTKVVDSATGTRVADFDAAGFMVKDRVAVGTSTERSTTLTRDATTHVVTKVTDAAGRTVASTYNANLQATSTTYTSAGSTRTETAAYDGPQGQLSVATDAAGNATSYAYGADGLPSKITSADGRVTTMSWNADGLLAGITPPGLGTTTSEWIGGVPSATVDPTGRRTQYGIDALGRRVNTLSADGGLWSTGYDAANQVTRVSDPLGGTTDVSYDAVGNQTKITGPTGSSTSTGYDAMDRVVTATDALGKVARTTYTADGLPQLVTDRKGQVTEYGYDSLRRATSIGYGRTGSAAPYAYQSKQTFSYDGSDRLAQVSDTAPGAGSITFGYDAWGNPTTETSTATGGAGTVTRSYDAVDRLLTSTVSGQPTVSYGYTKDGLVNAITQGAATTGYTFDAGGRVASMTQPGGVKRSNGYDAAGRPVAQSWTVGATTVGTLTQAYDAGGRLVARGGTLARSTLPAVRSGVTVNAAGQITAVGGTTYGYDANGALTSTSGGATASYTWDARGRLTATGGAAGTTTTSYDALGRRTRTVVGGQTYDYRYDGTNTASQDAPGTSTEGDVVYLRGPGVDDLVGTLGGTTGSGAPTGSGAAAAYLTDPAGSVVARTVPGSTAGALAASYGATAYGATTSSLDGTAIPDANAVRYTGRESGVGVPTGLQYNRARWYDPALGRFISPDPAGGRGSGTNLYAYAGGDPVDATDPTGQYAQIIAGCVIGAVLNTTAGVLLGRKHTAGDYLRGLGKGCLEGALFAFGGMAFKALRGASVVAEEAATVDIAAGRFAQRSFSERFSKGGLFSGRTINSVAEDLASGALSPADVPINVVVRDGYTLITNTRSAQALIRAGIPRESWNVINRTGDPLFEELLTGQLTRNGLGSSGFEFPP